MNVNHLRTVICLSFLLLFGIQSVRAQESTSSPYSRYGPGDLLFKGYAHERGMGGTGIASWSAVRLNGFNPATLCYDTVMVLEGGFSGRYETFKQGGESTKLKSADFNYFSIGLPVWRTKCSVVFGAIPYASTGYKINDVHVLDTANTATTKYIGTGGYNRYYLGAGFKLGGGFSLGMNANYLYGTIDRQRKVEFTALNYFNTRFTDETNVSGLYLDFGLHYLKVLSEKRSLAIGLTFAPSQTVRANRQQVQENYSTNAYGIEVVRDTVYYVSQQKGNITLPVKVGFGVQYNSSEKCSFGLDVIWQDWTKYSSFGSIDSLRNSTRVSAGMQFVPDPKSSTYFNRVQYRAGAYFDNSYLELRNTAVNDMGVSIGFGLPFHEPKGLASRFNLAIEAGQRGTTSENLIRQRYIRLVVGISLNEDWFRRVRYD